MGDHVITSIIAILLLSLTIVLPLSDMPPQNDGASPLPTAAKQDILETYGRLPLLFIQNQGQLNETVEYYVKSPSQTLYFTKESIVFDLIRNDRTEMHDKAKGQAERLVFNLAFRGANSTAAIECADRDTAVVNHFTGNDPKKWHTDIPAYRELVYKDLYPNIDLRLYGSDGMLRYDFIVNPGATPDNIALAYNGIDRLSVEDGGLIIGTAFGDMRQSAPCVYQQIEGEQVEIKGSFKLTGDNSYGFAVAAYNKGYPLIIDPFLIYSTYLGGSGDDDTYAIAVDSTGCVYITGETDSSDFPTLNPIQAEYAGERDAYVTKLSASGNSLIYSTYLGGSKNDSGFGIIVDSTNCVYVAGVTYSSDFPTQNPYQENMAGDRDAFITKLSAAGNSMVYSTYLGGSGIDVGYDIAVDSIGCAYITGTSGSTDFPTLNPFQNELAGARNVIISKLSATGNALVYSTYLGGETNDIGYGIAIDSTGCAYITGVVHSDNFPTQNPFQEQMAGEPDAFVAKLSNAGNSLVFSTYLGGSEDEWGERITLDSTGCAYVTGPTHSDDFPTLNPIQVYVFDDDVFVTKLSNAGNALVYSTYLGGNGSDAGQDIAVDTAGCAYVTGSTCSDDFPTRDPIQPVRAAVFDAFATKLSAAGNALVFSTFLGGSDQDYGRGIAIDSAHSIYITGRTESDDFPTQNPYQGANAGNADSFVAKLSLVDPPTINTVNPNSGIQGQTLTITIIGNNFSGATNVNFGDGITVNSFIVNSATQITVSITIATDAASGDRNVRISTPVGAADKAGGFTVTVNASGFGIGAGQSPGSSGSMSTPMSTTQPVVNPSIIVQSASLSQSQSAGEPVTVNATMSNTSTVTGTINVKLYVNGQVEASQAVTVESEKTTPVSFTVSRSQPGIYDVYVGSVPAGSFKVNESQDPSIILYISSALLFFAFVLGILYITKRRNY